MDRLRIKYGHWALVAGAAKGLGESFCKALATRGFNIVLVDNQADAMNHLAERLRLEFGIETKGLVMDLIEPNASSEIITAMEGIDCRLMIYNAAFSRVKRFLSQTEDDMAQTTAVNVSTLLMLVHNLATKWSLQNQPGGILLMSSLAGLLGMPLIAPYAATKSFTRTLAEALYHELKPAGIDITACIAGATATETYLATKPRYGLFKPQVQQPDVVAETALRNIGKKAAFILGWPNRVNYFILTRLLPRAVASRIASATIRNMYPDA